MNAVYSFTSSYEICRFAIDCREQSEDHQNDLRCNMQNTITVTTNYDQWNCLVISNYMLLGSVTEKIMRNPVFKNIENWNWVMGYNSHKCLRPAFSLIKSWMVHRTHNC